MPSSRSACLLAALPGLALGSASSPYQLWNLHAGVACAEGSLIDGEQFDSVDKAQERCFGLSDCFGVFDKNCKAELEKDATPCDEASWPDRRNGRICGECKVLVDRLGEKYETCDDYCTFIGRTCVAAWDESADACFERTPLACNESNILMMRDAICECSPDTFKEIPNICDEGSWPDKDRGIVCGDCKVMVQEFNTKYKTCNGYCESIGRSCVGAWEDDHEQDNCVVEYNLTCDQEVDTPDAICECSPEMTQELPDRCDEGLWPDVDRGVTCGDCKVLVDNFDTVYKTCDAYCAGIGMLCASAANEVSDTCEVKTEMTCDEIAVNNSDVICECIPQVFLCSAAKVGSQDDLLPAPDSCVQEMQTTCSATCKLPGQAKEMTCEEQIRSYMPTTGSMESEPMTCEMKRQVLAHQGACQMCSSCNVCELEAAASEQKFSVVHDGHESLVTQVISQWRISAVVVSIAGAVLVAASVLALRHWARPASEERSIPLYRDVDQEMELPAQ